MNRPSSTAQKPRLRPNPSSQETVREDADTEVDLSVFGRAIARYRQAWKHAWGALDLLGL